MKNIEKECSTFRHEISVLKVCVQIDYLNQKRNRNINFDLDENIFA